MRLLALGWFTSRCAEKENRRQIELTREVIDDPERRLPVIVKEPAVGAQHTQLQRIAAFVIGAAAMADLNQILRRQTPMLCEFILARIGRHSGPTPEWRPEIRVSRRH